MSEISPETRPPEELFLLHLRYKEAENLRAGASPLLLNDVETVWIVYGGSADLFAVPTTKRDGSLHPSGSRFHLARLSVGDVVMGLEPVAALGLLVVGDASTRLIQVPQARLQRLARDSELGPHVVAMVERWVSYLSHALFDRLPPKETVRLDSGSNIQLDAGSNVCAKRSVLWMRHLQGHSQFASYNELPKLNGVGRWPLSERAWVTMTEESSLDLIDTPSYFQESPLWADLARFHNIILQAIAQEMVEERAANADYLARRVSAETDRIDQALRTLATPFSTPDSAETDPTPHNSYIAALQRGAIQQNIDLVMPPNSIEPTLDAIARASRFQYRRVALRGMWWQQDNGPLLAFLDNEAETPVALIPSRGGYKLHDATSAAPTAVTETVAEQLKPFADMLYRTLPTEQLSAWKLIRFGLQGDVSDFGRIGLLGAAAGLLALLIPLAMGRLTDQIIPNDDFAQLWQIGALLLVAAVVMTLWRIVQNLSVLRLQSKLGADLQAAVWDRVLHLPVSFFRDYSAGDLGLRVLGISWIQQQLSGTVLGVFLSGVFSLFSFLIMFSYDWQLGMIAVVLTAISVAVTVQLGRMQITLNRKAADLKGDISSNVLQSFGGIAKLRVMGAEGRAFATWANQFGQAKRLSFQVSNLANRLRVFNSGYRILIALAIFAMVVVSSQQALTTGQFLAFNSAFSQFFGAMLALSGACMAIFNSLPMYERALPLLEATPEVNVQRTHPGDLTGKVEVSGVSFRYSAETPHTLKNVSLSIEPGQFIAIVGASGSGKSTLLRILLGFEQPESGAVYYDGRDLRQLDVREVRRQLGVVLQNGIVTGGTIFENIIGSLPLTEQDAWAAAGMAGLAGDIGQMPMRMHTVLGDGGGTLSGGQRQRLLIARAIVNKPRLVYFDEATSALDSETQATVSASLETLQATRIVIAHRLSTIMNADHIFVMDNGQIVEQGDFATLMDANGLFAQLAQRQTI